MASHGDAVINLQATLAASSANADPPMAPHHPITCPGELAYAEDGSLSCPHATAPADDRRTRSCLDHSVAMLLIEAACWELPVQK